MRPRVAVVAPHFPEYTLRLANALAEHRDVLLFVDKPQFLKEYAGREPAPAPGVELHLTRFESVFDFTRMAKRIHRFDPQVVHLQEAAGRKKAAICTGVVLASRRTRRIALTVHDVEPHEGRDADNARKHAWFRRYVRRAADIVFVHGQTCHDEYRQLYPRAGQQLVAIDHGVLLDDWASDREAGHEPLALLCFGRMEAYKGLDILHQAVGILAARGIEFRLDVSGSGPELERLQDSFASFKHVSVLNQFVSPVDLLAKLQACDAVLLPYLGATQSGVLAAAFGNGCFVIASRVGGIPDVVSDLHNGLLVPPGDAEALACAIQSAVEDQGLRERLKAGARETVNERLNWRRIASVVDAAYADDRPGRRSS